LRIRHVTRRPLTIAVTAIVAVGAFAATAAAVLTPSLGKTQTQMSNVAETDASSTSSTTWVPVPGSDVPMTLSASGLINARFTAESACTGAGSGWCSVRIVVYSAATSSFTELNPASGTDFAFDSDTGGSADDLYESNAMERSIRLPAGSYRFRVEYAVRALTSDPVTSRLDDWHFAVEASA
jgi:hypothetical protein